MLTEGRIGLVYCVVNFSELYRGQPDFRVLVKFLTDRGYHLVTFYRMENKDDGFWSDALFRNDRFFTKS